MSWCDRLPSVRWLAGLACCLALGACDSVGIHPLYMSHGGNLQAELQAIAVDPVPNRLGHYLNDKLKTLLNGTGADVPPRYHLTLVAREHVQTALVDTVTSRPQDATVVTDVDYRLTPVGGGPALTTGTVTMAKSYDRSEQRYANIRAARDAEIRDAETNADLIVQRISAFLATR